MGSQQSTNIQNQIRHINKNREHQIQQSVAKQQHRVQPHLKKGQEAKSQPQVKEGEAIKSKKYKEKIEIQPIKKHPMIEYQEKMLKIQQIPKKRQSKYKDQYFECAFCTQNFNVFDRIPMMICMNQHTYCQLCIKQYFEKIKQCPECRQPYNKKLIVKHRLLFQILMDQDDDLIARVIQREIMFEQEQLKIRNKYPKVLAEKAVDADDMRMVQKMINPYEQVYVNSQHRQYKEKNANLKQIPSLRLQPLLLVLVLDNNRIRRIEGMDHLKQLKMLSLKDNLIEKIQNLEQLTQLRFLFLQNNAISIVENLDLVSIRQIYLQNNRIKKKQNKDMILYLRDKGVDMHF